MSALSGSASSEESSLDGGHTLRGSSHLMTEEGRGIKALIFWPDWGKL